MAQVRTPGIWSQSVKVDVIEHTKGAFTMNVIFTHTGMSIGRDATDKPIRKESTVIFQALKMLNNGDFRRPWVRFYPDRHGLTASRIGVRNRKTGEIYWHGNYAIESASEAWNQGKLFLNKA